MNDEYISAIFSSMFGALKKFFYFAQKTDETVEVDSEAESLQQISDRRRVVCAEIIVFIDFKMNKTFSFSFHFCVRTTANSLSFYLGVWASGGTSYELILKRGNSYK